ncbi:MAG: hypothetical protein IJ301_00895 [Clostridia bacterium]|nr:hypothetical protein [Clostridia bacterium]
MKTNIAFICLLENYAKNVSKIMAEKLEMFYVNVDDMVQFELGDAEHVVDTLGKSDGEKYINKCENKVVGNVTSFENTIICMNPTTMFSNDNFEKIVNTSYVVYLQISPKFFEQRCKYSGDYVDQELNNIAFTERDKFYVEKSDIVLNCSAFKEQKAVKKLMKAINKFFKKMAREHKRKQVA